MNEIVVNLNDKSPTDQLIEKWSKTGLLEDIAEMDKGLLARNLEDAVKILVGVDNKEKDMEIQAGMFLPIIVRLFRYKNVRVIDNMLVLWAKFHAFFKEHRHLLNDLNAYLCQDGEQILCELFVEQYEE